MKPTSNPFWAGLIAAWLALAGVISAPAMASMAALATGTAPICGEHGADGGGSDHAPMVECALCLCCAPLLAVLAAPLSLPLPSRVVLAFATPTPPARAPPHAAPAAFYPRGPPASI